MNDSVQSVQTGNPISRIDFCFIKTVEQSSYEGSSACLG